MPLKPPQPSLSTNPPELATASPPHPPTHTGRLPSSSWTVLLEHQWRGRRGWRMELGTGCNGGTDLTKMCSTPEAYLGSAVRTELTACCCRSFRNLHSLCWTAQGRFFSEWRRGGFSIFFCPLKGPILLGHRVKVERCLCQNSLSFKAFLPLSFLCWTIILRPYRHWPHQALMAPTCKGQWAILPHPISTHQLPLLLETLSLFQCSSHFPLASMTDLSSFSRLFSDPWPLNIRVLYGLMLTSIFSSV